MNKNSIILSIASLICFGATAQNSAVVNSIFYLRDSNFVKAKDEIDKAVVNEKTVSSTKAWYTKGEVYESIANSVHPSVFNLDTNAIFVSYEAYQKSISLDKPNGTYAKQSNEKMHNVWTIAVNTGINAHKESKFAKAIKYYTLAQQAKPNDTTAYVYATYAALSLNDKAQLFKINQKLLGLNYSSITFYLSLIQYARDVEKNYDLAFKYVETAKEKYPNEGIFVNEEFNIYLAQGNLTEGRKKLEEAIAKDPKNSLLFFNLAVICDGSKDRIGAINNYLKAIELKSDNVDAMFNLGALYYYQGMDKLKEADSKEVDLKKSNALVEEANKNFALSRDLFEKVRQFHPGDEQAKKILKELYARLNQQDKYQALMKE